MNNDEALKNKAGQWLLKGPEDSLKNYLVPRMPQWVHTSHLTYLTLLWSAMIVLFFYWGTYNYIFYWLAPIFVVMQYLTDLLDGALGRYRNTGLVKWGYYVDHFLDFVFMCSIVFGYAIVIGFNIWAFLLFAVASGIMVHTFLLVSTNNEFKISFMKLGPTEGRLIFCLVHLAIVYYDIFIVIKLLPYFSIAASLILIYSVWKSQAMLWKKDMEIKGGKIFD